MRLSKTTKTGQIATAEIITCAPSERRNRDNGAMVYRVGMFRLASDRPGEGWNLMPREYRTLNGLLKAAKNYGITAA